MTTLQWLAGYFDANASIGMTRATHKTSYVVQVQVTGKDPRARQAVLACYDELGVTVIDTEVRDDLRGLARGKRYSRGWHLRVMRIADTLKLLKAVAPLLVIKQDRALLAVEYLERRAKNTGSGRAALPYTERDHEIFELMRDLQTSYKQFADEALADV